MNYFKNRIQSIITGDGSSLDPFYWLLRLFSCLYAVALKSRQTLYRWKLLETRKLPCRVISIGNLTAGGTGKTPMAIYVTRLLQKFGYKTAVLSRGYKGEHEKSGGVVSDGRRILMTAAEAGDEPFLLAQNLKGIPVLVGRDRFKSGMTAVQQFGVDVVVLDDAFQHIRLEKDVNFVLLDERRPFGNGRLLPSGLLREPVSALKRSDAVILTRCSGEGTHGLEAVQKAVTPRPVFKSRHVPKISHVVISGKERGGTALATKDDKVPAGERVFAFSGLADNHHFKDSIEEMGFQLVGFAGFSDHHAYTEKDLTDILQSARAAGAGALVTTEKDFTKISGRTDWPLKLIVVGIHVVFADEPALIEFIKNLLQV